MFMFNTNIPEKYKSMNYEQLSREAMKLINKDGWYKNFISLYHIHNEMKRLELADREKVYEIG